MYRNPSFPLVPGATQYQKDLICQQWKGFPKDIWEPLTKQMDHFQQKNLQTVLLILLFIFYE